MTPVCLLGARSQQMQQRRLVHAAAWPPPGGVQALLFENG